MDKDTLTKLHRQHSQLRESTFPDIQAAIQCPERYISHAPSFRTDKGEKKEFFIPYNLPEYLSFNRMHPLICEYFPFIRKAGWNIKTYGEDQPELFPELDLTLGRNSLIQFAAELSKNFENHPIVKPKDILKFVPTRGTLGHILQPPGSIALMHTLPLMYNKPFVLHIENPITTLLPGYQHGQYRGENIHELPSFHLAKYLLESPFCLAVFSHLKSTAQQLGSYFQSNIINDKTLFCPFKINYSDQETRILHTAYTRRRGADINQDKVPVIFFSGSHNQLPDNFFNRGGLDILIALRYLHDQGIKFRAVIKSVLPPEIKNAFVELGNSGADITLIEKPVSDEEMTSLHAQSDIYLLPAAGIHAHSTMRGLSSGNTCIISDAPQFKDFIEENIQALVVEGQNARIYLRDPKSGWLVDTYSEIREPNITQIEDLIRVLHTCLTQPEIRQQISQNAWTKFGPDTRTTTVQNGVNRLLEKIAPEEPSAEKDSLTEFREIIGKHRQKEVPDCLVT